MNALTIKQPGGLENILVTELADPGKPKAGEIRVQIKANSINYHDLLVALGSIPTEDGRIPLSDGAGIIEEIGEGVTEFKVGDRVISTFFPGWQSGPPTDNDRHFKQVPGDGIDGFAAESVVRAEKAFTLMPRDWSFVEASTITTAGATVWRALVTDGHLRAGETVLIEGTGGVSITALILAKAMNAKVIVTSSSDEKLERVKKLGADFTINYKTQPKWSKTVLEMTDGLGVDHVVEVGGPETLGQAVRCTRVGGHIAQIGILTGRDGNLPIMHLMARHIRLQGLLVGSRQDQKDFVKALNVLKNAKPVIDKVFSARDLRKAFEYQQSGKHFGKICVEWD